MQCSQVRPMRVIVNPVSGRGYGAKAVPTIERLLTEHGLAFDLVTTSRAGEAVELARQSMLDGYETVVAVGGDGTSHEVINGMLSATEGVEAGTLGLIPVGSGCDFAWSVGIPSDLAGACARLAEQRTKVVDIGTVTLDAGCPIAADGGGGDGHAEEHRVVRYFDNTVGIGFDGVVTFEVRKFKRLRGLALYLPAVLKTVFLSFRPARSLIQYEMNGRTPPGASGADCVETHSLEKTILMATICNGQREGGGFYIAPDARNDDGLLDVCIADNIPRLQILGMIPYFMKGTHVDKPPVTMLRSRRIEITSPDPLIVHADGEILSMGAHHVACEVASRRIRVIG